jgi:hypothetical protein
MNQNEVLSALDAAFSACASPNNA